LSHFCKDSSIDIILISFLNVFPDQGENGYPGTNFWNHCGGSTYTTPSGDHTQLLSDCSLIGPDIKTCQSMGKKILLSLGDRMSFKAQFHVMCAVVSHALARLRVILLATLTRPLSGSLQSSDISAMFPNVLPLWGSPIVGRSVHCHFVNTFFEDANQPYVCSLDLAIRQRMEKAETTHY